MRRADRRTIEDLGIPGHTLMETAARAAVDAIAMGQFSDGNRETFKPIVDSLLNHDEYLLLADFQAYIDCSEQAAEVYKDQDRWTRMSILNSARCGFFSSDRSMRQYCEEIWGVKPVSVS